MEEFAVKWWRQNRTEQLIKVLDKQEFVIHPKIDWLGCTPDGFAEPFTKVAPGCPYIAYVLEIKAPAKPAGDDYYQYYMPQVQGQMEITNRDFCLLLAYNPDGIRLWEIRRSPIYWNWMYPLLEEFWGYVQRDEEPARLNRKPVFKGNIDVEIIL